MAARRIRIFIALTTIFSLPGYWLDAHAGVLSPRLNSAVSMWAPALAAFVTLSITDGHVSEIG